MLERQSTHYLYDTPSGWMLKFGKYRYYPAMLDWVVLNDYQYLDWMLREVLDLPEEVAEIIQEALREDMEESDG